MSLGLRDDFRSILLNARAHEGMTSHKVNRLVADATKQASPAQSAKRSVPPGWERVAGHAFFRRMAALTDATLSETLMKYIKCVATSLDPSDRLIVDRVLALGLEEGHAYAASLTTRRERLFAEWQRTFATGTGEDAAGSKVPSTFRQREEPDALNRLADALDKPTREVLEAFALEDDDELRETFAAVTVPSARQVAGPRVVVIGAAVMDFLFRIPRMPDADGSEPASLYERHPGGKGLTQAVAARRLGLRPQLIAAIGDDQFGEEILAYLDKAEVDTTLVRVIHGESTPVTAVITPQSTGISIAIGWRNQDRVALRAEDLETKERKQALATCKILLATLEPPLDVIEHAISAAHDAGAPVIVTPAPPPAEPRLMKPTVQKQIGYLVSNDWEFTKFSQPTDIQPSGSPGIRDYGPAAERLLNSGVRHVLISDAGMCHAYYRVPGKPSQSFQVPAWPTMQHESAGARDAFCGMLALQLSKNNFQFSKKAVFLATAAMAYSVSQLGVPDSMPTLEEVEAIVESGQIPIPED
jgi:ribokinase